MEQHPCDARRDDSAGLGRRQYREVPDSAAEQAKMQRLGYENLDERLAERFHTTIDTLKLLNPDGRPAGAPKPPQPRRARPRPLRPRPPLVHEEDRETQEQASYFTAGQQIRVPNIGADRIDGSSIRDNGWQETLLSLGVGTQQPNVAKVVVSKSGDWLKGMMRTTSWSPNSP